jgi:5-methylcytosine-specific restriction endonuclease McrA
MKVVVLNADLVPINVTTYKKGYKLLYKGKAEIILADDENVNMLSRKRMPRPKIIRLLKYVYLPYRVLTPSKNNVFRRDGYQCGYCGVEKDLTIDHILPRSRGGNNDWENLVTCCTRCNGKKDDRTPEEAGMKLRVKPFAPTLGKLLGIDPSQIAKQLEEKYSQMAV